MKILFYEVRHFSPNSLEFQAIIRLKKKKKWHGPLSHWCREGKTLVVRPLKNHFFLCVSSLRQCLELDEGDQTQHKNKFAK